MVLANSLQGKSDCNLGCKKCIIAWHGGGTIEHTKSACIMKA